MVKNQAPDLRLLELIIYPSIWLYLIRELFMFSFTASKCFFLSYSSWPSTSFSYFLWLTKFFNSGIFNRSSMLIVCLYFSFFNSAMNSLFIPFSINIQCFLCYSSMFSNLFSSFSSFSSFSFSLVIYLMFLINPSYSSLYSSFLFLSSSFLCSSSALSISFLSFNSSYSSINLLFASFKNSNCSESLLVSSFRNTIPLSKFSFSFYSFSFSPFEYCSRVANMLIWPGPPLLSFLSR